KPSVKPERYDTDGECDHRHDHREIIRAGVAAVRPAAVARIEDAGGAHPGKRDAPNSRAPWDRKEEPDDNRAVRESPGQGSGTGVADPIFFARTCHRPHLAQHEAA